MAWRTAYAALAIAAAVSACAEQPSGPATKAEIFARYQAHMQNIGFMRTDPAPEDAPFSNQELAENFQRIAFFTYPGDRERIPKPLTRWEGPVRYAVLGTDEDRLEVKALMKRIRRLTGLSIRPTQVNRANFLILAYDDAEKALAAEQIENPKQRKFLIEFIEEIEDCGAIATWSEEDPRIRQALVYLHGDLEGLYRKLCFHEEIAQSFGLFNDHPKVRPSIFNDDEEFALLTAHDELLLRILYNRRLKSGMRPYQAMPRVEKIIKRLRPE